MLYIVYGIIYTHTYMRVFIHTNIFVYRTNMYGSLLVDEIVSSCSNMQHACYSKVRKATSHSVMCHCHKLQVDVLSR